jgi:hypothetical protein
MFRNQIKRGIRAVKAGDEPLGLCHIADTVIPTYCNDTVACVATAATPTTDKQLMRETGRRLAEAYLKDRPLMTSEATAMAEKS